jgi:hypothetical protein
VGFLRRLLGGEQSDTARVAPLDRRPAWMRDGIQVHLCEGWVDLDVVGEARYQGNLWRLVDG